LHWKNLKMEHTVIVGTGLTRDLHRTQNAIHIREM
jgi:hypothetical protein